MAENKNYVEYRIPKSYGFPEKIKEKWDGGKKSILHQNEKNDIYKASEGVIIVEKDRKSYDLIGISGNVELNKSRLEKLLGERFTK
jgi:hypothetical protein